MVLRFIVPVSFLMGACAQPQPSEAGEKISGEELYEARCIVCHGIDGNAGLSGASDLSMSKLKDLEIRNVIEDGRNSMPAFKSIIESEETLNETIEFVKSLRK